MASMYSFGSLGHFLDLPVHVDDSFRCDHKHECDNSRNLLVQFALITCALITCNPRWLWLVGWLAYGGGDAAQETLVAMQHLKWADALLEEIRVEVPPTHGHSALPNMIATVEQKGNGAYPNLRVAWHPRAGDANYDMTCAHCGHRREAFPGLRVGVLVLRSTDGGRTHVISVQEIRYCRVSGNINYTRHLVGAKAEPANKHAERHPGLWLAGHSLPEFADTAAVREGASGSGSASNSSGASLCASPSC